MTRNLAGKCAVCKERTRATISFDTEIFYLCKICDKLFFADVHSPELKVDKLKKSIIKSRIYNISAKDFLKGYDKSSLKYINDVRKVFNGILLDSHKLFMDLARLFEEYDKLQFLNNEILNFDNLDQNKKIELFDKIMNYRNNYNTIYFGIISLAKKAKKPLKYNKILEKLKSKAILPNSFIYKNWILLSKMPELETRIKLLRQIESEKQAQELKKEQEKQSINKYKNIKSGNLCSFSTADDVEYISIGHMKFRVE